MPPLLVSISLFMSTPSSYDSVLQSHLTQLLAQMDTMNQLFVGCGVAEIKYLRNPTPGLIQKIIYSISV